MSALEGEVKARRGWEMKIQSLLYDVCMAVTLF